MPGCTQLTMGVFEICMEKPTRVIKGGQISESQHNHPQYHIDIKLSFYIKKCLL